MTRPNVPENVDPSLAAESRLQVGAALVLGLTVLAVVVLRAGVHNVLPAGWWHRW